MTFAKKYDSLIAILRKSKKVNSLDSDNEMEAVRLAHAILDMSDSFKAISEQLIPKLTSNEITSEEIEEILLDIGEELRHVVYHIKDTRFYDYIV
jgi:hypothetical protein